MNGAVDLGVSHECQEVVMVVGFLGLSVVLLILLGSEEEGGCIFRMGVGTSLVRLSP